jgi:5-methylcytosine-specific restriction endonuclease McrA
MSRVDALVRQERHLTLQVLHHLIEIDRRKLYLPYGYSSLFTYCVRRLGYSESAALRRVRTARCIREHPDIGDLLESGDLTLSTVSKLTGVLTADNKNRLLSEVRGKSQREVGEVLSRYRPERAQPDRVRPVSVWTPSLGDGCKESYRRSGGKKLTTADANGMSLEQRYRIEFTATREFMRKLQTMKALLYLRYPCGIGFAELFELTMDRYIDRNDPDKRLRRRRLKEEQKATQRSRARTRRKRSRHIPVATRDDIRDRDGGRCTFVGSDGVRCDATKDLQIDHIRPFAQGGQTAVNNLRLLCGKHNRLEAERVYGKKHMGQFRRE